MPDLRSSLIRLAHSNPEIRGHLLPILKTAKWDVTREAEKIVDTLEKMRDQRLQDLVGRMAHDLKYYDLIVDMSHSWIVMPPEDGFGMYLLITPTNDSQYQEEGFLRDLFIREFNMGVGLKRLGDRWAVEI